MTAQNDTQTPIERVPFADPAGEELIKTVYSYWKQLRAGNALPRRQDIAPSDIDAALPFCFIAQRMAPGVARMRVAGQSLRELLNMDARGMPLSAFITADAHAELACHVDAAFSDPAIIELALASPRTLTKPAISGRLLLLPLRESDDAATRLFGALVTDRPNKLRMRRFDLTEAPVVRYERPKKPSAIRMVSEGWSTQVTRTAPPRPVLDIDKAAPLPTPRLAPMPQMVGTPKTIASVSALPNPPRGLRLVVDNT